MQSRLSVRHPHRKEDIKIILCNKNVEIAKWKKNAITRDGFSISFVVLKLEKHKAILVCLLL